MRPNNAKRLWRNVLKAMKTLTWLGWFSGVAGPGFTLVDQAAPAFNKPTRCMLTVDVHAVRLHQLTLRRQELFDRLHAVRYCLRPNFITISSSRAGLRPASEQLAGHCVIDITESLTSNRAV